MTSMTTDRVREGGRPLRDALYGELVWSRPGIFRRELYLEAGSERLASLRWERMLSLEAVGESADGRWIIGRHRIGSLRGQVVVRDAATEAPVATFTRHWRRTGVLRFDSGAEYKWEREGFWRTSYFWSSGAQERLLAYTFRVGFHSRYEMEVSPAAQRVAELPVLVLLGAYLMVLTSRQNAAH